MVVYSYESFALPAGIELRPAGDILDASLQGRFRTDGRPNVAHFADLFRLAMLKATGRIWIDADVLCLERGAGDWPEEVIVRLRDGRVINCVLSITDKTVLDQALAATERLMDRDLSWAATQNVLPGVLRHTGYGGTLAPVSDYCPIDVDDWAKPLLPEDAPECARLCREARTLHLYNNVLQKVGYLKSALPPPGSYLRHLLDEMRLSPLFSGEYSAETVRNLSMNWRLRFSGEALGVGAVARQFVPSVRRTISRWRHR
ncbi:MAG: hypothetical protein U1E62_19050 [Alsobacter sp.]